MKKCLSRCLVAVSLLVASSTVPQAQADVKLPHVIASHMVLQRDRPLPIWGWADPSEEITVPGRRHGHGHGRRPGQLEGCVAGREGRWQGPPHDRQRQEQDRAGRHPDRRRVDWLRPVEHGAGTDDVPERQREAAAANYPKIRLLLIPKTAAKKPAKDVQSPWVRCQPDTVEGGRLGWLLRRALLFRPAAAQRPGRADRVDRERLGGSASSLGRSRVKRVVKCTTA